MTTGLKISVITVCFNAVASIERALLSVSAQLYPHVEYIVVDGASTDGTLEILARHQAKISMLISEKDNGIFDAMNKGLSASTGDIIHFLNADDRFCDENVLTDIARAFEENQNKILVYGKARYEGAPPEKIRDLEEHAQFKSLEDFEDRTICHQAVFVKRSLFAKIGKFNCRYPYAADYDWLVRAFKRDGASFLFLDRVIVDYHYFGRSFQYNIVKLNDFAWIRLKHMFSCPHAWYYFRYVLLRGFKKWVLHEPW